MTQMTRLVSHNLARNSIFMSSPTAEAIGLAVKTGNVQSEALEKVEKEESARSDSEETEKKANINASTNLDVEIKRTLSSTLVSPTIAPLKFADSVFIDYKYSSPVNRTYTGIDVPVQTDSFLPLENKKEHLAFSDTESVSFFGEKRKMTALISETAFGLEVAPCRKIKMESQTGTDAATLMGVNTANISAFRSHTKNTIAAVPGVDIIPAAPKPLDKSSVVPREEAKVAPVAVRADRKVSLTECELARRNAEGSFDHLKSFFVLVRSPCVTHMR